MSVKPSKSVVGVEKRGDGIAIVSLQAEPVNIMGREFWRQLLAEFEALESDASIRGVVFQSGLKKPVFAAGLDINELYAKGTNEKNFHEYWSLIGKTLQKIYSTPKVTVAAIKGQCPAGGCILALCCDYRVISADGSMGLNEVALGMGGVPFFWAELMSMIIGHRKTEWLISTGKMATAEELLQMSMVDAVVAKPEDSLPRALQEAAKLLKLFDVGRVTCKNMMRKDFTKKWTDGIRAEGDFIWNSVSDPPVLKNIEAVLVKLSGAGKKPAPAPKL